MTMADPLDAAFDSSRDVNATRQAEADRVKRQLAQRADELWRTEGGHRGSDLEFWLRAEREVLERVLSGTGAGLHGTA